MIYEKDSKIHINYLKQAYEHATIDSKWYAPFSIDPMVQQAYRRLGKAAYDRLGTSPDSKHTEALFER